jgi:hypothetical protein
MTLEETLHTLLMLAMNTNIAVNSLIRRLPNLEPEDPDVLEEHSIDLLQSMFPDHASEWIEGVVKEAIAKHR